MGVKYDQLKGFLSIQEKIIIEFNRSDRTDEALGDIIDTNVNSNEDVSYVIRYLGNSRDMFDDPIEYARELMTEYLTGLELVCVEYDD